MVLKMYLALAQLNYNDLSVLTKMKLRGYAIRFIDFDIFEFVIKLSFAIPDSRASEVYRDAMMCKVSSSAFFNNLEFQTYRSNPCAFRAMSRSVEIKRLESPLPTAVISLIQRDR